MNCLDAHLGQKVFDKDEVVEWCIVLVEIPLSWPLPKESLPNGLANQLWCIDFLTPPTPLFIPLRLPAFN